MENKENKDIKEETVETVDNSSADIEEEVVEEETVEMEENGTEQADDDKSKKDKKIKNPFKKANKQDMELAKKDEQIKDLNEKYQRLLAEFENARKRNEKEKTAMYDCGAKDVLEKLLPVIDNFERGLASVKEDEKELPFVQGVEKIYTQFIKYLEDVKVTPMNAEGKEFNPDFHNAVMHIEDENVEDNIVVEEFQKGYMYKESVLRHSMVKVAN